MRIFTMVGAAGLCTGIAYYKCKSLGGYLLKFRKLSPPNAQQAFEANGFTLLYMKIAIVGLCISLIYYQVQRIKLQSTISKLKFFESGNLFVKRFAHSLSSYYSFGGASFEEVFDFYERDLKRAEEFSDYYVKVREGQLQKALFAHNPFGFLILGYNFLRGKKIKFFPRNLDFEKRISQAALEKRPMRPPLAIENGSTLPQDARENGFNGTQGIPDDRFQQTYEDSPETTAANARRRAILQECIRQFS